jgi:hypothetical protein
LFSGTTANAASPLTLSGFPPLVGTHIPILALIFATRKDIDAGDGRIVRWQRWVFDFAHVEIAIVAGLLANITPPVCFSALITTLGESTRSGSFVVGTVLFADIAAFATCSTTLDSSPPGVLTHVPSFTFNIAKGVIIETETS